MNRMATTRICSSCCCTLPTEQFYDPAKSGKGCGYKTCRKCRARQKDRQRAINSNKGVALGRYVGKPASSCADCERELTPNRTILLDGESLCLACRRLRFFPDEAWSQDE